MIQKIKLTLLSLVSLFMFSAPLAVGGVASALTQTDINGDLCSGSVVEFQGGGTCGNTNGQTANNLVAKIINIVSLVVGAVAVIMLIVGGFRYITSGGKQDSVASAKNTILYAIIGLVIVALAQLVVHFVINTTNEGIAGQ